MTERDSFTDRQYAFAAHIRDPENVPPPAGIEERRIAIYRELFFNNLKSLLATTFPVIRRLLGEEAWGATIRSFMQKHRAGTPYFPQLPAEFLAFLEQEPASDDYPFLVELAHYEYIELALSMADIDNDLGGIDQHGDLLAGVPVSSALAWVYAYRYPVHRISPDYRPGAPGETPHYLAVVRDPEGRVQFHELNPAMAALLEAIDDNADGLPGERLLRRLAADLGMPDADAFVRHGLDALEQFRAQHIIIGSRPPDQE